MIYLLRPHIKEDEPFIYDTFLKHYREVDPNNFRPAHEYFNTQRQVIYSILKHSTCLVACDAEDPSYLYGYILYDNASPYFLLHWLHIKQPFRTNGWAREILTTVYPSIKKDIIVCTHKSRVFKQLKKRYKLVFDPYKEPDDRDNET